MVYQNKLIFNPASASVMHIDLNSCFASIEQQANHLLRGTPLAIAASSKSYGVVLAPSIEAKQWGIKVGMNVAQAKQLCPWLVVKLADPNKYRIVNQQFHKLLSQYTSHLIPKSIDEFVLYLRDFPAYNRGVVNIAKEIKSRIKQEIGDWLRVSIGISTNQNLAKLASNLNKPDGLDIIDHRNFQEIFKQVQLRDFSGINYRNEARLNRVGVFTTPQFHDASVQKLKSAFQSVLGQYWYTRLRGWEIDDVSFTRRTFGQSYVLPRSMKEDEWLPILAKLVDKGTRRMRAKRFHAYGVHLSLRFSDKSYWHKGKKWQELVSDPRDIYKRALALYQNFAPHKPVKKISVTCFDLEESAGQLTLYRDLIRQNNLIQAVDDLNDKWGSYTVSSARLLGTRTYVHDTIAFGK